jgi:lipid kinase YegS
MSPRSIEIIAHAKAAADPALAAAVGAIRRRGHAVNLHVSAAAGDAERLAAAAAAGGAEAVVAAGGDGTLNEVLQGVVQAGLPARCGLGIIPGGTANDFAAGCGIPTADPLDALELIAGSDPVPIDVGRLGERVFLNMACGGFGTEVTTATPPELKHLLGGVAYLLTGLFSWDSITAKPVRLRGPGLDWSGNLFVLAVGNGRQAGGGFRLCERAKLDDGLLDVVALPDVPFLEMLGLLGELMTAEATPGGDLPLQYHQVPWLEVEAPDGMQLNLDGEPLRGATFRFDVLPRQLPVFLPPGAPLVGRPVAT